MARELLIRQWGNAVKIIEWRCGDCDWTRYSPHHNVEVRVAIEKEFEQHRCADHPPMFHDSAFFTAKPPR